MQDIMDFKLLSIEYSSTKVKRSLNCFQGRRVTTRTPTHQEKPQRYNKNDSAPAQVSLVKAVQAGDT